MERDRTEERDEDGRHQLGFVTHVDVIKDLKPAQADASTQEDAEVERQMDVARRSMRKHRNVLAELAK